MKVGRALQTVTNIGLLLNHAHYLQHAKNEQFETNKTNVTQVQHKNTCPESPEQVSEISQSFTA